jgi:O-antigen ligase
VVYPKIVMLILLSVGILSLLFIVIWPTEGKLLFAAISPYFLLQLADDFFGIELSGLEDGGVSSILQIGICVICSGAVVLLMFLVHKSGEGRAFTNSKLQIFAFAWIGLILLKCFSIFLDPTKWVPIANIFCFTVTIVALTFFGSDLQRILKVIVHWGLISSAFVFIGILMGKTWTISDDNFTDPAFEKNTYFSPLSELFGLPIRNNFYFNSGPQILGITFALLFCAALALHEPFLKYISIILFLSVGSLSGSRTFYTVVLIVVVVKVFSLRSRFSDLNLLRPVSALMLISAGVYFIVSSYSSNDRVKSINGRTIIWGIVSSHWNDDSLLGHGPGTLAEFARNAYTFFPFLHAHNTYLQLLWDFGVLGLFFAILISILAIYCVDFRDVQNFTFVVVALFVIQTEITLEASVMNPFTLFWVASTIQFLHKVKFYTREATE